MRGVFLDVILCVGAAFLISVFSVICWIDYESDREETIRLRALLKKWCEWRFG